MHMEHINIVFSPSFSASRFCLVDRGITFAIAHVRGGGELGDVWHEEGKKKLKKYFLRLYCMR